MRTRRNGRERERERDNGEGGEREREREREMLHASLIVVGVSRKTAQDEDDVDDGCLLHKL